MNIQQGAQIIIRDWVQLRSREKLLIVSSRRYQREVDALSEAARQFTGHIDTMILPQTKIHRN